MIKAKYVPGGTLLTAGASEPPKVDIDPDDFLCAVHAVAERYGCSPSELVLNDLAYRMAIAREPEFQVELMAKRETKPTVWTPGKLWRLWVDVQTVRYLNDGKSIAWCVNRVRRMPHWLDLAPSSKRFYDARNSPLGQGLERMLSELGYKKTMDVFADIRWDTLP